MPDLLIALLSITALLILLEVIARLNKCGLMVHDKLVLVAGNVDGNYQQVTTLGSQNLTGNALKMNTESTLQSHKPEDYQKALDHFNQLYTAVNG